MEEKEEFWVVKKIEIVDKYVIENGKLELIDSSSQTLDVHIQSITDRQNRIEQQKLETTQYRIKSNDIHYGILTFGTHHPISDLLVPSSLVYVTISLISGEIFQLEMKVHSKIKGRLDRGSKIFHKYAEKLEDIPFNCQYDLKNNHLIMKEREEEISFSLEDLMEFEQNK